MPYDWPVVALNATHPRLGTFGEFRGVGANDITRLHSGTDIAIAGPNVEVYAPSVGLVRRFGPAANGNPSGGTGPIRVGRFGFNHITHINTHPGSDYNGVAMPANLPIYVVETGGAGYRPNPGVANPSKDADFQQGAVPNNSPVVAWHKRGQNDYVRATLWPRTLPIGRGVGPTDLHCIYYESDDGRYADGASVANCLEVFRNYANNVDPVGEALKMYTQAGDALFLDLGQGGQAVHRPPMGGLDFKLWAQTPFNSTCGVYRIEYEIFNHLGSTTTRRSVWTFHKLPSNARSFDLVDRNLSNFANANKKHTVYIITNSVNGVINAASHWEVENAGMWPDGCYAIKVWIHSIQASPAAAGGPVPTNEVLYGAEWTVRTQPVGRRTVKVVDKFKKRAANWTPAFAECRDKRKKKRRVEKKRRAT